MSIPRLAIQGMSVSGAEVPEQSVVGRPTRVGLDAVRVEQKLLEPDTRSVPSCSSHGTGPSLRRGGPPALPRPGHGQDSAQSGEEVVLGDRCAGAIAGPDERLVSEHLSEGIGRESEPPRLIDLTGVCE